MKSKKKVSDKREGKNAERKKRKELNELLTKKRERERRVKAGSFRR